jgi:surface antigen
MIVIITLIITQYSTYATILWSIPKEIQKQESISSIDIKEEYTIVSGDTPFFVAKKFWISVTHLLTSNAISKNEFISWKKILITQEEGASISIEKATSVSEISKKFWVSIDDILATNPSLSEKTILQKTEIFIPQKITTIEENLKPTIINANGGQRVDLSKVSKSKSDIYLSELFTTSFWRGDIKETEWTLLWHWYQRGSWNFWFAAWQCTDYAAFKRPDIFIKGENRPFWWNAKDRADNAKKAWYEVDNLPKKNDIAVFAAWRWWHKTYGHVAYVEEVDIKKWTIIISDMNYLGKNIVTRRVISFDLAVAYIH